MHINALLKFLQKNTEWICSMALVFFAFILWWVSRKQFIQPLRFKRLELAQKLDHIAISFWDNSETFMQSYRFLVENQSNFKFSLKKVCITPITSKQEALQNFIIFNKHLNSLTKKQYNTEYDMVKFKSENESLKPYKRL